MPGEPAVRLLGLEARDVDVVGEILPRMHPGEASEDIIPCPGSHPAATGGLPE